MRIITVLLLVLVSNVSFACGKHNILTFSSAEEGKVRVFSIPNSKKSLLPGWSPGSGPIPIAVNQAYLNAKAEFIKTGALEGKGFELANINILHKAQNKTALWFYFVTFVESPTPNPVPGQSSIYAQSRGIVVLLDGTVLPGKVIPEKEFYKAVSSDGC